MHVLRRSIRDSPAATKWPTNSQLPTPLTALSTLMHAFSCLTSASPFPLIPLPPNNLAPLPTSISNTLTIRFRQKGPTTPNCRTATRSHHRRYHILRLHQSRLQQAPVHHPLTVFMCTCIHQQVKAIHLRHWKPVISVLVARQCHATHHPY